MKTIHFDSNDDKKKGHYSPAVIHNNIVYVSGQLPIPRGKTTPPSNTIEEQTKIVLEKLKEVLEIANSSINNVLKTTIYLSDISYWDRVNDIYADFFGEHKPARSIVPTKSLHYNCLIELEAIAYTE
ncbi:MAG: RidA family protein [Candidatus Heimdallarchaeota archaeon]|nr:RidA family protein [Candidatus Heimdallarchaeota archaeon]